jgi:septal ring factor EnvC (AmiA/AmiB activator)
VEELARVSQELDATNRAVEHLREELRARTEELQQVQAEMPDQAREIRHLRSALNVRQDEMMRWQAQLEKRGERITHATDAPASVRGGVAALEGSRRRRWTAPLRVMPRRVRGR